MNKDELYYILCLVLLLCTGISVWFDYIITSVVFATLAGGAFVLGTTITYLDDKTNY